MIDKQKKKSLFFYAAQLPGTYLEIKTYEGMNFFRYELTKYSTWSKQNKTEVSTDGTSGIEIKNTD